MRNDLKKFGVNLRLVADETPIVACGRHKEAGTVVHHDHILDLAAKILRDDFLPRIPLDGRSSWYDAWCHKRGQAFYDLVTSATTRSGHRLVRFAPVRLCGPCNSKDGNGKPGSDHPDLDWYSMTTDQLVALTHGTTGWEDEYQSDRAALVERTELMRELVALEIATVHAAGGY